MWKYVLALNILSDERKKIYFEIVKIESHSEDDKDDIASRMADSRVDATL